MLNNFLQHLVTIPKMVTTTLCHSNQHSFYLILDTGKIYLLKLNMEVLSAHVEGFEHIFLVPTEA